MKTTCHSIAGVILAAGSSSRMDSPKALLEASDGRTLLAIQRDMLAEAGCSRVVIVIGAEAERIRKAHAELEADWTLNEEWEMGQFSSLIRGMERALSLGASGVIVLPVDAAGVTKEIAGSLIETALRNPHLDAVIPEHDSRKGHPVFLSRGFCEMLAAIDPADEAARLDRQLDLSESKICLPVGVRGICTNINSMDDWLRFIKEQSIGS